MERLIIEIRRFSKIGLLSDIKTIYIGGGTPSFIGNANLNTLIQTLALSISLEQVNEFTVEVNPDSFNERMFLDMYALGVDRISMGVQSFDDEILSKLGRVHNVCQVENSIEVLKTRPVEFSLDLICGIPGMTDDSFTHSLESVLASGANHVSVYPLTIETGTVFDSLVKKGLMEAPESDIAAKHMEQAHKFFVSNGFKHYEVASFARPGFEAKHNSSYWNGTAYLGLGVGASGMIDASLKDKLTSSMEIENISSEEFVSCKNEEEPVFNRLRYTISSKGNSLYSNREISFEYLSDKAAALEDAMLSMRTAHGISKSTANSLATYDGFQEAIDYLAQNELICADEFGIRPTFRGMLLGNEIYERIWSLAL